MLPAWQVHAREKAGHVRPMLRQRSVNGDQHSPVRELTDKEREMEMAARKTSDSRVSPTRSGMGLLYIVIPLFQINEKGSYFDYIIEAAYK